jgi:hypothetical protein
MEDLISYKIDRWPFRDFHYVCDLIDFEGPILVHYSNNSHNALYYWVDSNEKFNRWLCFEVKQIELYNYLFKNISLFELIRKKNNEPFFIVEIDKDLKYSNFQMLQGYLIPEKYYPDYDSIFIEEVPAIYDNFFSDDIRNPNLYREWLSLNSIDLCIKANKSSIYSDTVSSTVAGNFLRYVSNSMKNYGAHKFLKENKESIQSPTELTNLTKKVIRDPRIVYNKQSSFYVSLATDYLMESENIKEKFIQFRRDLASNYQKEILSLDLNSSDDIEKIINSYDEYSRKQIFDPLIKIINLPGYDLRFIDKTNNESKVFPKVRHQNKNKIISKTITEATEEQKKVFVTLVIEVPENTNLASISKRVIESGAMSIKFGTEVDQELQKIESDSYDVIFARPIHYKIKNNDGLYKITFEPLNITFENSSLEICSLGFLGQFIDIIEKDYIATTPQNIENKTYLENLISEIIEH